MAIACIGSRVSGMSLIKKLRASMPYILGFRSLNFLFCLVSLVSLFFFWDEHDSLYKVTQIYTSYKIVHICMSFQAFLMVTIPPLSPLSVVSLFLSHHSNTTHCYSFPSFYHLYSAVPHLDIFLLYCHLSSSPHSGSISS